MLKAAYDQYSHATFEQGGMVAAAKLRRQWPGDFSDASVMCLAISLAAVVVVAVKRVHNVVLIYVATWSFL